MQFVEMLLQVRNDCILITISEITSVEQDYNPYTYRESCVVPMNYLWDIFDRL